MKAVIDLNESDIKDSVTDSLRLSAVISRLKSLTRYEVSIAGGCECCGSWIEHEASKYGEWVKVEDIEKLISELQANRSKNEDK